MSTEIITRAEARAKGLKFYFTGKPCPYGHVETRKTIDRGCMACRSRIDKKSYYKHQDKRIAKSANWNANHPERRAEIQHENIESGRAAKATRKWTASHRDEVNAYRRRITAANPGFRIRINLSSRLFRAVRYQVGTKSARTLDRMHGGRIEGPFGTAIRAGHVMGKLRIRRRQMAR